MKRRKTLVRAVALFMVGLITALALVIPTSAIVSQYMDDRNNPTTRCPIPFDVRFWYELSDDEDSLYFGYDIPIGYGSTEQSLISGGLDSAEGKKFNDSSLVLENEGFRANYSVGSPTYINYMTAWGETIDWWGYIPVELDARAVGRDNFDGIAIDAPTFYYNVWESTFYQDTAEGTKLFSMPTIQLPTLDDGKVYVGRYSVSCYIYDTNGEPRIVEYSIPIDQRVDNTPIPFLNSGIFEQYLTKTEDDLVNNYIVAIDGFQAFIDVDVYELVPLSNTFNLRYDRSVEGVDTFATYTFSYDVGMTWGDFIDSTYNIDNMIRYNSSNSYCYAVINGTSLSISDRQWDVDGDIKTSDIINLPTYYCASVIIGGGSNDVGFGGDEAPGALDEDFDWGGALDEPPGASVYEVTPTADDVDWQIVADSPDKCTRLIVTYPIHKQVGASIGGGSAMDIMNRYSYPDWFKYDESRSHTISTDVEVDFTGWIATATSGFLNFELLPNFSIGGVLAILVGFSLVILFLKVFAGG